MINYNDTLKYLYDRLPMFQRIGASAYKEDLHNTIALMNALGNPEKRFRSIHVAGTNGKGSSSHFIASILREQGLKVGLHTSPHLKDFRERIKINNEMCPQEYVVEFVERNKAIIETIEPSFFELAVAMAFEYFAINNVDIAVVEVGMGGRLDSTNIINPLVGLITNISKDHTQFLGTTIESIATEKAGIIKKNCPIVISQTQDQAQEVFITKANSQNSPIVFADQYLEAQRTNNNNSALSADIIQAGQTRFSNLQIPLIGDYQQKNVLGAIAVADALNKYHNFGIEETTIRKGIENLNNNFPLLGRWQRLSENPLTICDTGHNEDGLKFVLAQLAKQEYKTLRFVLGMVNDKDVDKVLTMLDKNAIYYLCKADIPRGLEVQILAEKASKAGLMYKVCGSVSQALGQAQAEAEKGDLIFVGGSTFTVAEVV
ncbi:MAG: folylpolyglutamate synthase/dihydrofolate synthase family protein [Bacteroidales bacterium]|jgi:dihydrofolate synthase/folylpolyglutamate synthase|nr:folylpolyglutamate synthase/dihydrofolate synthase family protein [Bacteroidales bacterium]